ncbi:MAG: SIMPL domain-containing protein [Synechococcus sp.]
MTKLLSGIAICILCLMGWGNPAIAQDIEPGLTVTGDGSVSVPTAIATIRLGVSISGDSATEVQQQIAERMDTLVSELQELNVDNLQTTGISLYPEYSSREDSRINRVRGTNTVQFEVPVEQAGQTLDSAALAGASQIDSVTFRPASDVAEAGRDEALRLAVADSLAQANVVLESLNLGRQSIYSIQVNSSSYSPEPLQLQRSAAVSSAASTPVLGGEQTINASVTLTVQY